MIIGYARVSTYDQNLDMQTSALRKFGCEKVIQEKKSAVTIRVELETLLSTLETGDTLVVWKLDRLGRSLHDLLHYFEMFSQKGINFVSLQDKIDTSTPLGKLFFQISAAFSEYERLLIVERTISGLKAAKDRGVQLGRKKGISKDGMEKARMAAELYRESDIDVREIADKLNITTATLYRYLHTMNVRLNRSTGRRRLRK